MGKPSVNKSDLFHVALSVFFIVLFCIRFTIAADKRVGKNGRALNGKGKGVKSELSLDSPNQSEQVSPKGEPLKTSIRNNNISGGGGKGKIVKSNLIQNPSFEMDRNKDGLPDNWLSSASGIVIDNETSSNGRRSAKITKRDEDTYLGQYVAVKLNSTYKIEVSHKGDSLINLSIVEYSKDNKILRHAKDVLLGKRFEWTRYVGSFTTSGQTTVVCVKFVKKDNGAVWIDNVLVILE